MPNSSTSPSRVSVKDLALGAEVSEVFLLSSAQQHQARNGPYWRLEFRDATGSIGGKIWSPQSQAYPELLPGQMARVQGRVTSFRDTLELSIEGLCILGPDETAALDLSLFMPASPYAPEGMMRDLLELADTVLTHEPWKRLIMDLLTDPDIALGLNRAPAAKAMHHAYAGGLLEHTLSVARLTMRLADHFPGLDRQVLLAGAVCHDLGKLWELTQGLATDYTTQGRLLGHMQLALERLEPHARRAGLEPHLVEHLQHLVLSHHGSREFGSPVLPMTAEALALHYADILDAKMHQVEKSLAHLAGEPGWSGYSPALERFLYKAPPTPGEGLPVSAASSVPADAAMAVPLVEEEPAPAAVQRDKGKRQNTEPAATASLPSAETEPREDRQPQPMVRQCSLLSKA